MYLYCYSRSNGFKRCGNITTALSVRPHSVRRTSRLTSRWSCCPKVCSQSKPGEFVQASSHQQYFYHTTLISHLARGSVLHKVTLRIQYGKRGCGKSSKRRRASQETVTLQLHTQYRLARRYRERWQRRVLHPQETSKTSRVWHSPLGFRHVGLQSTRYINLQEEYIKDEQRYD